MDKKELIYEGKGKKLYKTDDENLIIAEFKDDLTAFNAQKKSSENGKGSLNCQISSLIFELLNQKGINNHFIKQLDQNHMLCKVVKIIPLEVVVRNVATGSLTKRLGVKDGTKLPFSLVEFYYKNDALGDPIINDEHCKIMRILDNDNDIKHIKDIAREVNTILMDFFDARGVRLIDFKIEFGRDSDNKIILADEISPDSCRLWDKESNKKMDKDIFRENLGSVVDAYQEVLNRIK